MTRPLRIEFPDAIYHVNYRGNNRQTIFFSDEDREMHLERTRETVLRYGWRMFAFCQMTNHAHHYFQTPEPNLSAGMQFLLSGFARRVNASNGLCGHLLQGRFHDQLVENVLGVNINSLLTTITFPYSLSSHSFLCSL